jgi:hypothetical protein
VAAPRYLCGKGFLNRDRKGARKVQKRDRCLRVAKVLHRELVPLLHWLAYSPADLELELALRSIHNDVVAVQNFTIEDL